MCCVAPDIIQSNIIQSNFMFDMLHMYVCVYVRVCVCIYIYIYIYMEERRISHFALGSYFVGWANNHFNSLYFKESLEATALEMEYDNHCLLVNLLDVGC